MDAGWKPRIYFAASIRGGREDRVRYEDLITTLADFGQVLTEHVADANLAADGEADMSDVEIFERDLAWLRSADVVVAEVTTASLGVGYEIASASALDLPILCLFRESSGKALSAMIAGDRSLDCVLYDTRSELVGIITAWFKARGWQRG